jgi:hypothetical protein
MLKTETLWKSSFLAIALGGLYFAWKKPVSAQAIEQDAAQALPGPASVTFGGYQGAVSQGGDVSIGGSPVYLTYNYPAASNPIPGSGTTAAQGPSASPAPGATPPKASPCADSCCGGSKDCQPQLTPYTAGVAASGTLNDLNNLFSLLSK